jgi:hypothetical protein
VRCSTTHRRLFLRYDPFGACPTQCCWTESDLAADCRPGGVSAFNQRHGRTSETQAATPQKSLGRVLKGRETLLALIKRIMSPPMSPARIGGRGKATKRAYICVHPNLIGGKRGRRSRVLWDILLLDRSNRCHQRGIACVGSTRCQGARYGWRSHLDAACPLHRRSWATHISVLPSYRLSSELQ